MNSRIARIGVRGGMLTVAPSDSWLARGAGVRPQPAPHASLGDHEDSLLAHAFSGIHALGQIGAYDCS
jgi:hypothetical protein